MKLRIATVNIKNFPDIPDQLVRADVRKVKPLADVIGLQEIGEQADRLAVREELGDEFAVIVQKDEKGRKTPNPIAYRKKLLKVVAKGTILAHESVPGSGPRSFSWVVFEAANGQFKGQFYFFNTHFISSAWNDKPQSNKKQRQDCWTVHYLALKAKVTEVQKLAPVVLVGDFNRQVMRPITRKFKWHNHSHSIDKVTTAQHSDGPTFKFVGLKRYDLNSDHHAQVATFIVTTKETPMPVDKNAVLKAHGLQNTELIIKAAERAGLPLYAAAALMQKESNGRNVYGHDSGGVFSKDEYPSVTGKNFMRFLVRVMNGATSNGVGPAQITYAGAKRSDGSRDGGYFRLMAEAGLRPWIPVENMQYGFKILLDHYNANKKSWQKAGERYNGAASYGVDFAAKVTQWKKWLA